MKVDDHSGRLFLIGLTAYIVELVGKEFSPHANTYLFYYGQQMLKMEGIAYGISEMLGMNQ